jgi:lipoprotein-anchoring transpeptidase ErfK/SrfK
LFTHLVKGPRRIAGIADARSKAGFSATLELEINRSRGRGLRNRANYGLSCGEIVVLRGTGMTRIFALLVTAAALVAGTASASAQGFFDMRDIMGGGPNFRGGGSSPIARTTVSYASNYSPGTIVINTAERRLYLVLPSGQALRYGIGVGRDGFRWGGVHRISAKKEWPSWTPPSQMLRRRPDLPRHMSGGVDNPLGARAMYLGSTLYRIHGSNEPETIGQAVSSGCFRMTNDDVTDLYNRVSVGTTVVVKN